MSSWTLGSSSAGTLGMAIVGAMGIAIIGVTGHTFTFEKFSQSVMLDQM